MSSQNQTFLVEFPNGKSLIDFRAVTVSIHNEAKGNIIQCIETDRPQSSNYWTDWGGTYDNPESVFVVLFIEQFLSRVDNKEDLLTKEFSSFVEGTKIYFSIPYYLWQEANALSRIEYLRGFSSNVKNTLFPSDDRFNNQRYPVRMKVPSLPLRLSNPVNGIFLSPTFNVSLNNEDGLFDEQESSSIINNPITVYKSSSYPATFGTFSKIRVGEIENINLSMEVFSLSGADVLRTLEDPATRTLEEAELSEEAENMPIAYGQFTLQELIIIEEVEDSGTGDFISGQYIVVDPNYVEAVTTVYGEDNDNNPISIPFVVNEGVISTTQRAFKCDFQALSNNRLGEILINEVSLKSKIAFSESFWNIDEALFYAEASPHLNFFFSEGSVKQLVQSLLKNDMAFLIQQNGGRLTLRKWGEDYNTHTVKNWLITKKPQRTFSDFKYFYSSAVIEYLPNTSEKPLKYLNKNYEEEIVSKWKKRVRGNFKTVINNKDETILFSEELLNRFGNRAQIWSVSIGEDTSSIEILDTLFLLLKINERQMSQITKWKIIGIDPAQDSLIIEEDESIFTEDTIPLSHPFINYEEGFLYQPFSTEESGYLSENTLHKENA